MKPLAVIGVAIILLCRLAPIFQQVSSNIVLGLDDVHTTAVEGSNVHFNCDVVPWEEFLITGVEFFYNDTRIETDLNSGITVWGHALVLERITLTAAGKYECKVNTINGTKRSNIFYLSVGPKPNVIAEIPDSLDLRVNVGGKFMTSPHNIQQFKDVSLICEANPKTNATSLLKRKWFKDGNELFTNVSAGINVLFSTVELPHIEKTSQGIYACRVEIEGTILYSDPVAIYVLDKFYEGSYFKEPIFVNVQMGAKLNPDDIREFDDVYFTCNVKPITTDIRQLYWFHDGMPLLSNDQLGMIHFNFSTLILERITKKSAGRYTCRVDTDQGALFSIPLHLIVKDQADHHVISMRNKGQPSSEIKLGGRFTPENIKELDNVYFNCEIKPSTTKIRKLRWYYYGQELLPSKKVDILYDNTLVLPCIQKTFIGRFTCLAETDKGISVRSKPKVIDVKDVAVYRRDARSCDADHPTLIAELLHNPDHIYVNDEVHFYCNIYPKTTKIRKITWFRDDKILKHYVEIFIFYTRDTDNFITYNGRTLIHRRIGKKDIGYYICEVELESNKRIFRSVPAKVLNIKDRPDESTISSDYTGYERPEVIAELLDPPFHFYENDNVSFYCDVKPDTTQIQKLVWFRNSQKLSQINDDRISFNRRTLTIQVDTNSVGNYSCQIDTDAGTFKSNPTPLIKIKKGKVFRLPWTTGKAYLFAELGDTSLIDDIHEKDNIFFSCNIRPESTPWFELTWYRDDWPIQENKKAGIIFTDDNKTLNYYHVGKSATGTYTCQANTKKGYLYSTSVYLDVKNPRENPLA